MRPDEPRLAVDRKDNEAHSLPTQAPARPREEMQLGYIPHLAKTAKEHERGSSRPDVTWEGHSLRSSFCERRGNGGVQAEDDQDCDQDQMQQRCEIASTQ